MTDKTSAVVSAIPIVHTQKEATVLWFKVASNAMTGDYFGLNLKPSVDKPNGVLQVLRQAYNHLLR